MVEWIIFAVLAAISVYGALNVVLRKNPVLGALNLIMTILSMAGLYLLLSATFLAAVQIIVYAGAIMVLFLFVLLLINLDRELWDDFSLFRLPTPLLGVVVGICLVVIAYRADTSAVASPPPTLEPGSGGEVGRLLFTEYAFPFEIVSVILFAGMVGAIVLAKKRRVN